MSANDQNIPIFPGQSFDGIALDGGRNSTSAATLIQGNGQTDYQGYNFNPDGTLAIPLDTDLSSAPSDSVLTDGGRAAMPLSLWLRTFGLRHWFGPYGSPGKERKPSSVLTWLAAQTKGRAVKGSLAGVTHGIRQPDSIPYEAIGGQIREETDSLSGGESQTGAPPDNNALSGIYTV